MRDGSSTVIIAEHAQTIQEHGREFASRQQRGHEILMEQRVMPSNVATELVSQPRNISATPSITPQTSSSPIPSTCGTVVAGTIPPTPPTLGLITKEAVPEDTFKNRRSGRQRKLVKYFEEPFGDETQAEIATKTSNSKKGRKKATSATASKTASKPTTKNTPKAIGKTPRKQTTKATKPSKNVAKKTGANSEALSDADNREIAEERVRQEAALGLLKLTFPTSTTNPPESAIRESLKYAVDEDANAAAVILQSMHNGNRMAQMLTHFYNNEVDVAPEQKAIEEVSRSTLSETSQLTETPAPAPEHMESPTQALRLDTSKGVMPSAGNKFIFTSDSPSGRTGKQLDALLKPPGRPAKFPLDVQSSLAIPLSYNQLGTRPKKGLADKLVAEIERLHMKEVKELEEALDPEDREEDLQDD